MDILYNYLPDDIIKYIITPYICCIHSANIINLKHECSKILCRCIICRCDCFCHSRMTKFIRSRFKHKFKKSGTSIRRFRKYLRNNYI
jgi:hypothetical protein